MTRPLIRISSFALFLALPLILSGCSDARRALGYEKSTPDEFQVVEHPALSIPPDFTLRPPAPGAVRPQAKSQRDHARAAVSASGQNYTPITTTELSAGETALLVLTGADKIQPDVRNLIDKETQALAKADENITDQLIFWRDPNPLGYKEELDPTAESQRLRENQALGRPITEGETPLIIRGDRGMLEGIFN